MPKKHRTIADVLATLDLLTLIGAGNSSAEKGTERSRARRGERRREVQYLTKSLSWPRYSAFPPKCLSRP
ncbi:hypothetical protein E2C01_098205 [Portunus trituberculatus]|uniref:Uncharacterized protein n=1 Tax=Portunus trituberculatus TaxID=210409 RepID=A0A5B7K0M6_PORTR|nr:hypothetical protein [Portunus trituberculatus]